MKIFNIVKSLLLGVLNLLIGKAFYGLTVLSPEDLQEYTTTRVESLVLFLKNSEISLNSIALLFFIVSIVFFIDTILKVKEWLYD